MLRNHHTLQSEMNCAPPKNFGFSTNRATTFGQFFHADGNLWAVPRVGPRVVIEGDDHALSRRPAQLLPHYQHVFSFAMDKPVWQAPAILGQFSNMQYLRLLVLATMRVIYSDFCASRMYRQYAAPRPGALCFSWEPLSIHHEPVLY